MVPVIISLLIFIYLCGTDVCSVHARSKLRPTLRLDVTSLSLASILQASNHNIMSVYLAPILPEVASQNWTKFN